MDDHIINRLAKTDLFLSENVHHLEIQIETAMLMLEVMTVAGGGSHHLALLSIEVRPPALFARCSTDNDGQAATGQDSLHFGP